MLAQIWPLRTCLWPGYEQHQYQVVQEVDSTRTEIQSLLRRVATQRNIESLPSLDDFVDPAGEIVEDDPDTIEEQVLEQILEAYNEDDEEEEEGVDEPVTKVTLVEATRIRIL